MSDFTAMANATKDTQTEIEEQAILNSSAAHPSDTTEASSRVGRPSATLSANFSVNANSPLKSLLVKITPPQSRRLLTRPRILDYMEEGRRGYAITLLVANTGFGKTTALVDFARHSRLPLAWYSLDEEDKDPAVFCRYLLDAVRVLYPDFGQSFEELLGYNLQQLHQDQSLVLRMADEFIANLEELLAHLKTQRKTTEPSAELAASESEPVVGISYFRNYLPDEIETELLLVLDDYQFAESPALNRFVERLMWRMPSGLHLVIASRQLPAELPITPLVGKQMLYMIETKDLAFNANEINGLLKRFYSVDETQIGEALAAYSEGWITAVILALSNKELLRERGANWRPGGGGKGEGESKPAPVDFDKLFNYLAQEVFESQSIELQDFLLRTSILNFLNSSACDRLMKVGRATPDETSPTHKVKVLSSETLLRQIEQRNLFINRRNVSKVEASIRTGKNNEAVWQYHALFRQFLVQRLKQEEGWADLYSQLRLEAARWEQENGNFVEAVQQFVEAGAEVQAAVLLSEVADSLYESGRVSLVASLLNLIGANGETEINDIPELLSLRARIYTENGDTEKALQAYVKAVKSYKQQNQSDKEAYYGTLQAQLLFRVGERDQAAMICNWVLRDRLTLMTSPLGQQAVAQANFVLGTLAADQIKSNEAEKFLNEALQIYQVGRDDYKIAVAQAMFGQLYHNDGRLVRSNVYYQRALVYFVKSGNRSREGYVRTSIAINNYYQGYYQQAEEQLNEVAGFFEAETLTDQYLQLYILTYLANIYRETERYIKAERTYEETIELARQTHIRKVELSALVDSAFNYILQERKEEAKQLIQLSIELAEAYSLNDRLGYSYRAQAWLLFHNSLYKRSLQFMEKAIEAFDASKLELVRSKLGLAVILLASGEARKALTGLSECLSLSDDLGYEPFTSFEMVWSNDLFEYAAKNRRKLSEEALNFLTKRGFLQNEDNGSENSDTTEETKLPATTEKPFAIIKSNDTFKSAQVGPEPDQKQEIRRIGRNNLRIVENSPEIEDGPDAFTRPSTSQSALLKIYALDGSRVFLKNSEIDQWRRSKERELLFYLLENNNATKDQILDALWPDIDLSEANIIHVNLASLRKRISPVEIKISAGRYYLEGSIWYDASEFSNKIGKALALKSWDETQAEQLGKTLTLYKRDFLDQFYSDWVVERQQQLLNLYNRGTVGLARYYQETDRYQPALLLWKQFLVKEPYDEEAYRACIVCLLKLGNKAEAKQQSLKCLKALEEIDLRPSSETVELMRQLA